MIELRLGSTKCMCFCLPGQLDSGKLVHSRSNDSETRNIKVQLGEALIADSTPPAAVKTVETNSVASNELQYRDALEADALEGMNLLRPTRNAMSPAVSYNVGSTTLYLHF